MTVFPGWHEAVDLYQLRKERLRRWSLAKASGEVCPEQADQAMRVIDLQLLSGRAEHGRTAGSY